MSPPHRAPQSPAASETPAGWHSDPFGFHEQRYWDGVEWTEHVYSRPPHAGGSPATQVPAPRGLPIAKVARQARKAGVTHQRAGGGTIFTEQVLVVNQKARIFGSRVEYAMYNQSGQQIGRFQELRPDFSTWTVNRLLDRSVASREHRFQVVDMSNRVLLAMTRPRGRLFQRSGRLIIDGPHGAPIGQIAYEPFPGGGPATAAKVGVYGAGAAALVGLGPVLGSAAILGLVGVNAKLSSTMEGYDRAFDTEFSLEAGGQRLGSMVSKDRAWNFTVMDPTGTEVARITKTWAGWLKERFTTADNYVVQIHHWLDEPLRSLVIAAALAIDVELKEYGEQTSRSSMWRNRRYK